jgi:aryl-alcohol dehydrogenase-like predicted oxidoreductase
LHEVKLMTSQQSPAFAHGPSTIRLGDLEVVRLGFGAMRLPGPDVWGEPDDPARAREVLRRVVARGINLIDSAWFYGPHVANRLIAETLHPYPKDLVIASKLGGKRLPDKGWAPFCRPEELREGCETDLRELRRESLDVVHLRYMGKASPVPFTESLDAMISLKKEGKIRHLALSNVGPAELEIALARTPIVSVQNMYSVSGGGGALARMTHAEVEAPDTVLETCEKRGIAFMPFFPLGVGAHAKPSAALAAAAERHRATPAQIALAWLLARSPVMLPIPGTSRPEHLEENWAARSIHLGPEEVESIAAAARS